MVPYYSDDLSALYLGMCDEVLPLLPERSVDVVLTDPPFFMPATHYSSRVTWPKSWGDTSTLRIFWSFCLEQMIVKLKPSGHLLTFCSGSSYPVFYPETYKRFDTVRCLVWDKGVLGLGSPWRNRHELILAARWKTARYGEDKGVPDVLCHRATLPRKRSHPVEKPYSLIADLLAPISLPGQTILDPFAGGGSTMIASVRRGLKCIGIESEESYCEVIANRLSLESKFR